jgi:hypothetical protein
MPPVILMVKVFIGVIVASIALCCACVIVPLDPERPQIITMDPGKESVQLFVGIERGIDEEDGSRRRFGDRNFAVYVDGEPRAWIPETESYTLIHVTRGPHVVKIDKPYRGVFFFFGVPLPNPGGASTEELTINCGAEEICGVLVRPNIKKKGGLVLRILPVPPDQISRLMENLLFVETK